MTYARRSSPTTAPAWATRTTADGAAGAGADPVEADATGVTASSAAPVAAVSTVAAVRVALLMSGSRRSRRRPTAGSAVGQRPPVVEGGDLGRVAGDGRGLEPLLGPAEPVDGQRADRIGQPGIGQLRAQPVVHVEVRRRRPAGHGRRPAVAHAVGHVGVVVHVRRVALPPPSRPERRHGPGGTRWRPAPTPRPRRRAAAAGRRPGRRGPTARPPGGAGRRGSPAGPCRCTRVRPAPRRPRRAAPSAGRRGSVAPGQPVPVRPVGLRRGRAGADGDQAGSRAHQLLARPRARRRPGAAETTTTAAPGGPVTETVPARSRGRGPTAGPSRARPARRRPPRGPAGRRRPPAATADVADHRVRRDGQDAVPDGVVEQRQPGPQQAPAEDDVGIAVRPGPDAGSRPPRRPRPRRPVAGRSRGRRRPRRGRRRRPPVTAPAPGPGPARRGASRSSRRPGRAGRSAPATAADSVVAGPRPSTARTAAPRAAIPTS